ncbi:Serendipity locus alpha [Cinara cedri]|uniref:Serendipity locus alpha n=1 Tax=Cinara cedri TaxID=506608 RepID=A0A5E4NGJ9_9HEMI|nr:Serendipity locus alpha [Cinara cedri]
MFCVCLNQIRKCLLIYETTMFEQNTIQGFENVLSMYLIKRIQKCLYKLEEYLGTFDLNDVDEHPGIFIDRMNIVLSALNNKENIESNKLNIEKILFQAIIIAKVSDKIDNLEITSLSKHVLSAVQGFENTNVNDMNSFFQFDSLSSSLSILERRINTAVLHLIFKIFNDPFCLVKQLIKTCGNSVNIQFRDSSDLSSMISDLDKSTDVLIQIGLFSVACCKNNEYVIPLKCCISSLELLDSDMVPAIIEFYLDPTSLVKKTFLKILINHWVCEICEIQNLLDKIIDPFAYIQTTVETSVDIFETIIKSNSKIKIDLFLKLLNGFVNFTKYIEKIFVTEMSKDNDVFKFFKQYKNALEEYKSCLIFTQQTNCDHNGISANKKLLKRCEIVIKYLKNIQNSVCNILDNKSLSELENTNYILSKTLHPSMTLNNDTIDDYDDLNLIFSTTQVQKSFYNISDRKKLKLVYPKHDYLTNVDETTYGNTITMDLTNILDNFIETLNINSKTAVNVWDEIGIDMPTRINNHGNIGSII